MGVGVFTKIGNRTAERLIFRMLGIYHGAVLKQPEALDFSGEWLPTPDTLLWM